MVCLAAPLIYTVYDPGLMKCELCLRFAIMGDTLLQHYLIVQEAANKTSWHCNTTLMLYFRKNFSKMYVSLILAQVHSFSPV